MKKVPNIGLSVLETSNIGYWKVLKYRIIGVKSRKLPAIFVVLPVICCFDGKIAIKVPCWSTFKPRNGAIENILKLFGDKYYTRWRWVVEVRQLRLEWDLNPRPLDWYSNALLTEPSSHSISTISGGFLSSSALGSWATAVRCESTYLWIKF